MCVCVCLSVCVCVCVCVCECVSVKDTLALKRVHEPRGFSVCSLVAPHETHSMTTDTHI